MGGARWPFPLHRRAVLYPPLHQSFPHEPVQEHPGAVGPSWAQEKGLEHPRCGVQVRICDNTRASVEDQSSARDGAEKGFYIKVWGISLALHLLTILHLCSIVPIGCKLGGGTDRVPPGLSEGGSHGGARSNKLNLSSYHYTLAAQSSTLDSVLAAFSPLRRQDVVFPTLPFTAR